MEQNGDARDIVGTVAHMKKKGTLKILIIVLIIGAILFIVGSFFTDDEKKDNTLPEDENGELIGFFEYKALLEDEIKSLCSSVGGVKSVSAVVFFSETGGSLYAQNTQSGNMSSQKNEYVIIGSGSNAHALYLGESLPKLSGIGIVCNTGDSLTKRNEILSLLSAAYGIPMTRIYVTEAG